MRKSSANSETKGLLKVCGNEGLYLTKETKNANFLTSVYIFRFLERVGESRANRARGGSLLRRVKGSALNNPVSHWFSAPETVINLTISDFNEKRLCLGAFYWVLPMTFSSPVFVQSSLSTGASVHVFSIMYASIYLCDINQLKRILHVINQHKCNCYLNCQW